MCHRCRLKKKKNMALTLWHCKDGVTSQCSRQPSTHPEKCSRWRTEMKYSVLWEEPAEQAFRDLDIFRRRFLWAIFLSSSHILKSTKTINRTICSLWLAASLCQNVCWIACSPFPTITYTLTFLAPLLWCILRAIQEAVSWTIVLTLPQIKLSPHFTLCFFSFDNIT